VRIAICDDESAVRERLRETIIACEALTNDDEITEYSNGIMLINSHAVDPYDIIFLDIEMNGISGIEIGHRIRGKDRDVIIIFVTGHQQYMKQSFKVETFDYLVKPVDKDTVCEVLQRALKKHREQHYIVQFQWHGAIYKLDVSEIIFLESDRRHVIFVTIDNRYTTIGKLSNYSTLLLPYGFLHCHHSFLINMSYIRFFADMSIITTAGHSVPMSVRKKRDCLKAFNIYLSKYRI
jgi:DNA-binding LytR/AlgR family response regulator